MKINGLVALICLLSSAAMAGKAGAPGNHGSPVKQEGAASSQSQKAQKMANNPMMQKLQAARQLALSPDQQAKLTALENKAKKEMLVLRDQVKSQKGGGKGSAGADRQQIAQQLRPKMQQIGKELSQGIDAILTAEQRNELNQKVGRPDKQQFAQSKSRQAGFSKESTLPVSTNAPEATPAPRAASAAPVTTGSATLVNPFQP